MNRIQTLRIGNAGGYWGDDPDALKRQILGGKLDYVTMDFLAEVTMSILQKQRMRDSSLGYARDFIKMLKPVLKQAIEQNTKIITNAGGVNPTQCAKEIQTLADALGVSCKIAIVYGDDILDQIDDLTSKGSKFQNMESGESFEQVKDHLEAANIYFGAQGVVEALKQDPNIVITGRVTDTGITIGAMIHEFGWGLDDWDKLAAGIVAGHIIECGCQSTGGNFTDWQKVSSFQNIGYPIIEMEPSGEFIVTKHEGTGGLVSLDTIREQLFYEMGNPEAYITPDVVADFSTIQLAQEGENRVKVFGVKGLEPTPFYKVSMAYREGFKAQGSIMISGPDARAKAEAFARIFWERLDCSFEETSTEYIGHDACHRSLVHSHHPDEILLRLSARGTSKDDLRVFGKLIPSLILSGPPGVAVIGGVPKIQDVVSYWPALIDKKLVPVKVGVLEGNKIKETATIESPTMGNFQTIKNENQQLSKAPQTEIKEWLSELSKDQNTPLAKIALARSGDKGDMCNVGVLARSPEAYAFLKEFLTAQKVKDWFQELCHGDVTRFHLDHLNGLNFLLDNALGGGGTKTLRTDAQGKTFSQAILRQRVPMPKEVLESIK